MNFSTRTWILAAVLANSALTVACGGDDPAGSGGTGGMGTGGMGTGGTGTGGTGPGECQPLTHDHVAKVVVDQADAVLRHGQDVLGSLEGSTLLPRLVGGDPTDTMTLTGDLDEGRVDLIDYLRQMVFVRGNLVLEAAAALDYEARADVFCAQGGEFGTSGPEDEADCREFFRDHQVRWHVTRTGCAGGDSLVIELHVDDATPGVITVEPARLSATFDVRGSAEALRHLDALDPEVILEPPPGGKVVFEVVDAGPGKATAKWTLPVDGAVGYHLAPPDPERFAMNWGGGSQLVTLEVDATARRATGSVSVGPVGVQMLLSDFVSAFFGRELVGTADPTQTVEWSIAGFDAAYVYDRTTDSLQLTGLGLGTKQSVVRWQEQTLLSVDVNPTTGRAFALGVVRNPAGDLLLDFEPGFELVLGYSMAPIAAQVVDLQTFARDDTVTIAVAGTLPHVQLLSDVDGDVNLLGYVSGDLLRVTTGELRYTSRVLPAENVRVGAGQCLVRREHAGQHEMLRELAAGTCP